MRRFLGRTLAARILPGLAVTLLDACGSAPRPLAHTQTLLADCPSIDACLAACDGNRGTSCYAAGTMYETGTGAPQSYADAARLYARACDAGEPRGCNDLGVMREIGLGGAQDYAAAAEFYRRACGAGDAQACANLALRYEEGLGVPRDHAQALQLRQQACSLGVALACRQSE